MSRFPTSRSPAPEGRARPLGAPPPGDHVTRPQRATLPHATPPRVKSDSVFFLTICCQQCGVNQLCATASASQLFESVDFRQRTGGWNVHLLVLMPDHLHALASFPRDEDMRAVVANFKEITAKRAGVGWQRNFFDHRQRSDESSEEKAHYTRMNPVRKGLVGRMEDWTFVWEPGAGAAVPAVPPYPRTYGAAPPSAFAKLRRDKAGPPYLGGRR